MNWESQWEKFEKEPLGSGGQGVVYRVIDTNKIRSKADISRTIGDTFMNSITPKVRRQDVYALDGISLVLDLVKKYEDYRNHGALKLLHKPEEARDNELAQQRIRSEIEAMNRVQHPNLLKIITVDDDAKWFVSQYHPYGTLINNMDRYMGDFHGAILAFRQLVEGVAKLHNNKCVHRDIKPNNIFIGDNNELILGDFGLIYFTDNEHTRISRTLDNVGTRHWMPEWATGIRIEDITPAFDVFSLGKILWAMLSGKTFLRLWYFNEPDYNLVDMFPNNPDMLLANELFGKIIVEREKDCLPTANELLSEVDALIQIHRTRGSILRDNVERNCQVCGIGKYKLMIKPDDTTNIRNFGLQPSGMQTFKIFSCGHCGHVQSFSVTDKSMPPAWR